MVPAKESATATSGCSRTRSILPAPRTPKTTSRWVALANSRKEIRDDSGARYRRPSASVNSIHELHEPRGDSRLLRAARDPVQVVDEYGKVKATKDTARKTEHHRESRPFEHDHDEHLPADARQQLAGRLSSSACAANFAAWRIEHSDGVITMLPTQHCSGP